MDVTLIVSIIISLTGKVIEMSENWNNENYQPPSVDELKELIKKLEELPDLPE